MTTLILECKKQYFQKIKMRLKKNKNNIMRNDVRYSNTVSVRYLLNDTVSKNLSKFKTQGI